MNWKKAVTNSIWVIQGMIIFMLLFESKLDIPTLLLPLGRMHPLILHFPIVMIVLLGVLQLSKSAFDQKTFDLLNSTLLYATVFTTSLTALFGFFLAAEGGYTGDAIVLHKWLGIVLSFTVAFLLYLKEFGNYYRYLTYTNLIIVVAAGHFGATLTHGEGFLLEPIMPKAQPVIASTTPVYTAVIEPIFDSKCMGCHNPSKMKGDLDMSSFEGLMKGGKGGLSIVKGNAAESELMKRILLPDDHDDHMPPDGKPQLSKEEITLISGWIETSGDNVFTLASLTSNDSLYGIAQNRIDRMYTPEEGKSYDFSFADEETIEGLNNHYRTVKQLTSGSPALDVNIYVRKTYKPEFLSELERVSEQIVRLNLSYLPIEDKDLEFIASFPNLEKLLINYTDITGENLEILAACEKLSELSLSGTSVEPSILEDLKTIPSLQLVHVWDTEITPEQAEEMQRGLETLIIDSGFDPKDAVPLKLSPPLFDPKERVLDRGAVVELKHKLQDSKIYYTTDGSEPDSTSNVYSDPIPVEDVDILKAFAVKEGWAKSSVVETSFFVNGFSPESVVLTQPADQKYKGSGNKTLNDKRKGEITSFNTPRWLGYQKNPFEALVDFGSNPPKLDKVVLGYGVNMTSYIMDPVKIEVFGGNSKSSLKKLGTIIPDQPTEYKPNKEIGMGVSVNNSSFRYYKVVAYPVTKLPEWHQGKGEPGWVFVDELFFY